MIKHRDVFELQICKTSSFMDAKTLTDESLPSVSFHPDDLGGRKVFEGTWVSGRREGPGQDRFYSSVF